MKSLPVGVCSLLLGALVAAAFITISTRVTASAELLAREEARVETLRNLDESATLRALLLSVLERALERTGVEPARDPQVRREEESRRQHLAEELARAHEEDRRNRLPETGPQRPNGTWILWLLGTLLGGAAGGAWWWTQRAYAAPIRELAESLVVRADGSRARWRPRGAPGVRALGAASAQTLDDLEGARRELWKHVDAQTTALSRALEEQRGLNRALETARGELESAQDRLIQKEKLAALGTLSAGVSHEFNNILGGIRGLSQELLADARLPGALREDLQAMDRAAERGRKIVEALRTYSRGARTERARCSVRLAIAEVQKLLQKEAHSRGQSISVGDVPERVEVLAAPGDLEQILMNLLRNAIQASPTGAPIRIEVTGDADQVSISVHDQGHGVEPSTAPRLFEPFFTTRAQDGGSGLGLAIAHGLARSLQGDIDYAPRPGGGSIFRCRLPAPGESP